MVKHNGWGIILHQKLKSMIDGNVFSLELTLTMKFNMINLYLQSSVPHKFAFTSIHHWFHYRRCIRVMNNELKGFIIVQGISFWIWTEVPVHACAGSLLTRSAPKLVRKRWSSVIFRVQTIVIIMLSRGWIMDERRSRRRELSWDMKNWPSTIGFFM